MRLATILTVAVLVGSTAAAHAGRRDCERALDRNEDIVDAINQQLRGYAACVNDRPGADSDCRGAFRDLQRLQSAFNDNNQEIKDECGRRRR